MEHLDHVPARRGLVIFLNGTSSSGKSSIAAELLRILDEPYFHLPVDAFHAMRSSTAVPPDQLATVLHRTWQGFHRAVAGMAAAGNHVVVDHVLSAEWRLRDCLSLFVPQDVVLVKVHCAPEELERRERERGDRPAGLAAAQSAQVHAHGVYDVDCDTTHTTPQECARRIKDFLGDRPTPTAFERLRARVDRQSLQSGPDQSDAAFRA
ncbi:chloramphenicol phosphotransferase CPT family protein [Streptomyces sp. AC550_RSS872]|uniref:chloramphenicol phosphotransferase CPT family protein n=1 Tax=Streptomyces sp. AC550_RSS872 TaxID=2823689 RepID=UPI001C251750|nr:AAA family ATPase [Streptomyces sp. AC550_RSS872]